MKFSEIQYRRPDIDEIKSVCSSTCEKIAGAKSFEVADREFENYQKYIKKIMTMLYIAVVRHSINTEDEFYDKENDFVDEVSPQLTEYTESVDKALFESKFKDQLENKYGKLFFKNIELSMKSFSPEIIPQMQEENKLVSEYEKLLASAQIKFDNATKTLSEMTYYKTSPDNDIRNSAWKAEGEFYRSHENELDSLYDKLVKVRDSKAKIMGYDNYVGLGYNEMKRSCFDAHDIEKFRKGVIDYIVPLASELYKQQAERTGAQYPLSFADAALLFKSGNARPCGTSEDILNHAKKFYHELSPQTAAFIDSMYQNEMLDVLSRKGKQGGGYCIELYEYETPFIFANFNGTSGDVEVMTHEAGHAFAFYQAMAVNKIFPIEAVCPTMESAEIHSMSMEFFSWNWAEGFFGNDTEKFKYGHLFGAITFIPYGTMVDHFQHIIYEQPKLSPNERHDVWRKLLKTYMPWMKLDGSPFYGEGMGWQRQSHIYSSPFYYIDYCLAQAAALQFWRLAQSDMKDAWNRYMELVSHAGKLNYLELLKTAGLKSPFDENTLKDIAQSAKLWLDSADKSHLL